MRKLRILFTRPGKARQKFANGYFSYRRNFDLDKNNESHYHSWKEHLKMNKIAKYGCELLYNEENIAL
jgi:hypothetical protein